jgi:hypothetical protein
VSSLPLLYYSTTSPLLSFPTLHLSPHSFLSFLPPHLNPTLLFLSSCPIPGDNTNKRINMDWFFDRIVRNRVVPIPGERRPLLLILLLPTAYCYCYCYYFFLYYCYDTAAATATATALDRFIARDGTGRGSLQYPTLPHRSPLQLILTSLTMRYNSM